MRIRILQDNLSRDRWARFISVAHALSSYGIELVQENEQVILANIHCITEEVLSKGVPIIVCQRQDSAAVYGPRAAELLAKEHVAAMFKNTILDPLELNNCADARYHYHVLSRSLGGDKLPERNDETILSESQLRKLRCVIWDAKLSILSFENSQIFKSAPNFNRTRKIDVHYVVGKAPPAGDKAHHFYLQRERAESIISNLKSINALVKGVNQPALPYTEFIRTLLDAKICVSPWGYGEFCYRDIEAMLSGAVLIKPDTSFVRTSPELYQNDITYIPCRADLGDLAEKIRHILDNWQDFAEMRKYARQLITNSPLLTEQGYAQHLASAIHSAIGESV